MVYAVSWFVVFLLLALWSLAAWVPPEIAQAMSSLLSGPPLAVEDARASGRGLGGMTARAEEQWREAAAGLPVGACPAAGQSSKS